jgi:hypothetical protein
MANNCITASDVGCLGGVGGRGGVKLFVQLVGGVDGLRYVGVREMRSSKVENEVARVLCVGIDA